MKKVLIAFLLVALCFGSLVADVKLSGEFDYSAAVGEDFSEGKINKLRLYFNADLGDYNKFSMELRELAAADGATQVDPAKGGYFFQGTQYLRNATVTTDWAKVFGLPVALETSVGYASFGLGDAYYVSDIYWENLGGVGLGRQGSAQLALGLFDVVTLKGATVFQATDFLIMGAAFIDFAPVALQLGYVKNASGSDGILYAEGKFAMDVADGMKLTVVGGIKYTLDTEALAYSGGLSFAAFGAKLAVIANGGHYFEKVGLQLGYDVTDALKIDAAAGFDFNLTHNDSNVKQETFMGVLGGVTYTFDKVAFSIGYVYSPEDGQGFGFKSMPAPDKGGLYFKATVDF